MSISPLTIYLWQLADEVRSVTGFVSTLLFTLACIFILIGVIGSDDEGVMTKSTRLCRSFALAALPFCLLRLATPSSDTIAMMVVIPKIAESSVVQKDIPELYNVAIEALKNQLKGNQ